MNRDAQTWFTLRFAGTINTPSGAASWRSAQSLRREGRQAFSRAEDRARSRPHRREWAKMEERWFKMGDAAPVEEGEMTLRVAKLVATKLRALGARVSFVRKRMSRDSVSPRRLQGPLVPF